MADMSCLWPHSSAAIFTAEVEDREEGLLGNLDAADLLHPLLAFLLLLEQLALARDVAAVTLGDDVLADGLARFAGDDLGPDRGLDRHLVLLAWNLLAQALDERAAGRVRLVAVHHHRERVDYVAGEQDVHLHEVARARSDEVVVERG